MFFESTEDLEIDGEWQYGDSQLGGNLRKIETSLRCSICSDFFNNPHSLPCGHSFCSECIRKHLDKMFNPTTSDVCPSCREKAVVSQLRVSRDLIDIVQYFKDARPGIISILCGADTNSASSTRSSRRKLEDREDRIVIVQRMPQRVFHIESKDKVKKALEKLTEVCPIKIRTDGDKETLVKRYSAFVHLNNAQLSSKHPLSLQELVTELHRREKNIEKSSRGNKKTEQEVKALHNGQESAVARKGFADLIKKAKLEKAAKLKALSDNNSETQGASSIEKADVIELEYSQTQSQLTSPNERKRKLNTTSSQRPNGVLRAPSPARGKAVHGEWCVVWSEVMRRLFFYNMQTEVGQIDVPSELEPIYGQDGAEGPAIDTLRANMAAQDNRVVDMSDAQRGEFGRTSTRTQNWPDEECTLRDSQAEGDDDGAEVCGGEGEGAASGDEEETMDGLNLTGEDFAEDVTQCPGIVPSSPPPAAPTQTQVGTSQKQVLIVDDSPYNSMDESQSSVDPLLKRSAGGRVSSSFDIATAVMHKMEAAMMQNGEDGDPPGEDAPNECEDVIVPCPQCTFHNAPGASECEICLTKLLVGRKTRHSSQSFSLSSQSSTAASQQQNGKKSPSSSSSRSSKRARKR